jgi:hypothetical protein
MKSTPLAPVALALAAGLACWSAHAATTDVSVSATLRSSSAKPNDGPPTSALNGRLSFDAETNEASATIRLGDDSNAFKGSAWIAPEGVIFAGLAEDDTQIFFNLGTGANGTGSVVYCRRGTQCDFYTPSGSAVSNETR